MKAFFVNGKRKGTIEFYEEDGKKIEKINKEKPL